LRKKGIKRNLVVDAAGGSLGVTMAGANVHDAKLLAVTLEAVVVERPRPSSEAPQHLCLDKGYDNLTGHETVSSYQDIPYIRISAASGRKSSIPTTRNLIRRAGG
jgi:putative transposase